MKNQDGSEKLPIWILKASIFRHWERWFVLVLAIISPFLIFYNLDLNPRPWQDEGAYLTLAKTVAENGIYAIKSSEGYQSYGAVQSLGPTVILPVAWVFRTFGVGLLHARIIAGIFLLLTLWAFYITSYVCFDQKVAVSAIILLIASPAVNFFMYGRPVLGEAPAFGFFLAGWLCWSFGVRREKIWGKILGGLCLGAAMVTKSQYIFIGFASLLILAGLDLFYYRLGEYKGLIIVGIAASICVAVWYGWQIQYFGGQTFSHNFSTLGELAKATTGVSIHRFLEAFRFLFGSGSGYLYIFWGPPAIVYGAILASRRDRKGFVLALLVVFSSIWMAFFTFLVNPWTRYRFPATAIIAILVGKLFIDLGVFFLQSIREAWLEMKEFAAGKSELSSMGMMSLGTFISLVILIFWTGYQLQKTIREDVFDKVGEANASVLSPLQFSAPREMAEYLKNNIPEDKIIDTWERELGILTNHKYHYPDVSFLIDANNSQPGDGSTPENAGVLGEQYFDTVNPDYVIIGWYSRFNHIYDPAFLQQHARLVVSVGGEVWGYDLYALDDSHAK